MPPMYEPVSHLTAATVHDDNPPQYTPPKLKPPILEEAFE